MGKRIRRIAAWPDLFTSCAIALILGGLLEGRFWHPSGVDSDTFRVLSLCATFPILISRRYLAASAVIVSATTVASLGMGGRPAISILIGQYWIIYLVAARTSRMWTGVALLPLIGNAIYPYSGNDAVLAALLILTGGVLIAATGDTQRHANHAIAERNAAREEMAQVRHDRAVLAERSRIARELHDVVAHHVSMMVVQAETARVGTPGLGAEGSKSLEVIRDTGRQALTEMRRVVGVLRRDPNPDEQLASADRSPQPSLERIDDLVASARTAGTQVTLQRDIRPPALPAMVELCGYRIIQEALTNVRRHAPGASAEVVVRVSDRALHIRVTDNGPRADPVARQGHGLVGMRERAAMVGGRLWAGPLATGGFLVEAELPTYGMALIDPSEQRPDSTSPQEPGSASQEQPDTARNDPKPDNRAPDGQAPSDRAPDGRAPNDRAPDGRAPNDRAPDERAPDERAPDERAPDELAADLEPQDRVS